MKRFVVLVLLFWAGPALSQVSVEAAWARATAPNAKLAAGYLTVVNAGAADRLVGASSPAAGRVELHVTTRDGQIMRMRQAKALDVSANGRLELRPAGAHLMFVELRRAFRKGEKVPVTLRFEKAGEVQAELAVGDPPEHTERHKH